jgi:hypothetical protein
MDLEGGGTPLGAYTVRPYPPSRGSAPAWFGCYTGLNTLFNHGETEEENRGAEGKEG